MAKEHDPKLLSKLEPRVCVMVLLTTSLTSFFASASSHSTVTPPCGLVASALIVPFIRLAIACQGEIGREPLEALVPVITAIEGVFHDLASRGRRHRPTPEPSSVVPARAAAANIHQVFVMMILLVWVRNLGSETVAGHIGMAGSDQSCRHGQSK